MSGDASSLPILLNVRTVQEAWVEAVQALRAAKWELRTLTVHITEPLSMDNAVHGTICAFARSHGLPHPRWVARTIFPQSLYQRFGRGFYDKYNGPGGFYESIPSRHRRWGTYFRRLTHYETTGGPVNQLQNITTGINSSGDVLRAAYTAVLPIPGAETVKRLGGPCLHYLAFQLVPTTPPTVGLLAVYRNHEFLEKAYGNYWGLVNLLGFVAHETSQTAGWLTCVSSHAYVKGLKTPLARLIDDLP